MRFHLAIAKNNGPAVKAALVPLDVNRSPLFPRTSPWRLRPRPLLRVLRTKGPKGRRASAPLLMRGS